MLTYGDGVSDVNIDELVKFHKAHGKMATLTAVTTGQRFGVLGIGEGDSIDQFREKKNEDGSYINGGFMVLEPEIFDYIEGDSTTFEKEPLETVAEQGQLMAFKHDGFWQCMDAMRDKQQLEALWASGKAPWKSWN
jgi:glucose-1-phosphate cytidylyltransferase